jgi:hypothetical protein
LKKREILVVPINSLHHINFQNFQNFSKILLLRYISSQLANLLAYWPGYQARTRLTVLAARFGCPASPFGLVSEQNKKRDNMVNKSGVLVTLYHFNTLDQLYHIQ